MKFCAKGTECTGKPLFLPPMQHLSTLDPCQSWLPEEKQIFHLIGKASESLGTPAYLIGGFVRDKLLGRPTRDADIVCIGDGIALAHQVARAFDPQPAVDFFKHFGTAHIRIGDLDIEFVGARKESYRTDSRKPLVETGTLVEDQDRRDFTINALSVSLNTEDFGELRDPFNGIQDLQSGIIRTPMDPVRTFSDDPLRMMRAIRFATQLNFRIETKTFEGIKRDASRIGIVSQERITEELNKIILSPIPSIGFTLLYQTGLLKIIFPQMVALAGVEMIEGKGHKDNFYHTIQVLDNVARESDDLWLRWAAILHDIAKPATKRFEEGHGWTFHGHEVVGGRMVPQVFRQLKLPQNEKMRFVRKLVELHLRPISLTKEDITDSALRRLLFDAGDDIDKLMILCNADITSKNKQKVRRFRENFEMVCQRLKEVEEKDRIRNWQPPITGEMIMEIFGLPPSKTVGDIKSAIREAILDGEIANDYQEAYTYMLKKGKELHLTPVK